MSEWTDRLITSGLRTLGAISQWRTDMGRVRLGRTIGHIMMAADRRRLQITTTNVDRALPDLSSDERAVIVRGAYENLGITLAELLAFPRMAREHIMERMHIPGIELVAQRAAKGLPNILLSGHYGNWEMLALAGALHANTPFVIVAHPQKNRFADALLNSYRTRYGNRIIPMHNAARELIRVMQDGGTVAFLADQHTNAPRDRWVSFFGRPAPTHEAPAALALKFRASVFYAFARRRDDGSYIAPLAELPISDLRDTRDDVRELTRRHVALLEAAIREHPDLWSWQHRRWRDAE